MNTNFFDGVSTIDELKARYRDLAKQYHPDRQGGDTAIMQAVNAQYEALLDRFLRQGGRTEQTISDEKEMDAEMRAKVDLVINLEGVSVEIMGRWVWVCGNTFVHRGAIKEAGFFFASKKKCWFWRPEDCKSKSRRELSLDEIREMHGSKVMNSERDRERLLGR